MRRLPGKLLQFRDRLLPVLTGPPMLAFLPALVLGAFWAGGETALILLALGLPLAMAMTGALDPRRSTRRDGATGLMLRDGFDEALRRITAETNGTGLRSACFLLHLDDFDLICDRHGAEAATALARYCGDRLTSALRTGDVVARLDDNRFAICLAPVRQLDLELCIQLAGRLQTAIEEPAHIDGMTLYVSCSIGFCMRNRSPGPTATDWFEATASALAEARQNGPSSIRAFADDMPLRPGRSRQLALEATEALETGQIRPWFQPQISTDTGQVSGFEALVRWEHPQLGTLAPDAFLPAMAEAGLMPRMGQVMLHHALEALRSWDAAGVAVPRVAINFATEELRDPSLADRVRWELDRFQLTPDRLGIEILETVVADRPDDTVLRNIAELGAMGCAIELDDFGTGRASISAIRRFSVSRIKIDRSFVTRADRDPDQQRMIGAILTFAERLDLETLAEGVETVGEHALLAQLGCDHVQGFGIGRPMPFADTTAWIAAHRAKLQDAPPIQRKTG